MTAGNLQVAVLSAVIDRRLEFGHLCGVWSKNSPPRDRSGNPVFGDFRRQKSFVSEPEFLKIGLSGSISRRGVLAPNPAQMSKLQAPGEARGEGSFLEFQPRRGERLRRFFRPSGAPSQRTPTPRACARGYTLSPLRGYLLQKITKFCLMIGLDKVESHADSAFQVFPIIFRSQYVDESLDTKLASLGQHFRGPHVEAAAEENIRNVQAGRP